jgi:hypothetical protein
LVIGSRPGLRLGAQEFGQQRFPALLELDQILDEAIGPSQCFDTSLDPVQFALELSKTAGHSSLLPKVRRTLEASMIDWGSSNRMAKMGNFCASRAQLATFLPRAGQSVSMNAAVLSHSKLESASNKRWRALLESNQRPAA